MSDKDTAGQAGPDQGPFLPAVSLDLRRPMILCGILGILALMITGVLDHLLMGALICVGLALGLLNIRLMQNAAVRVTSEDVPSKQKMALSSAARLFVITAIALVLGFVLPKPDGLGLFAGLAIFQVVWVLNTTVPVMKGLRQQS